MSEKEDLLYLFKSLCAVAPVAGGRNASGDMVSAVANNNAAQVQTKINSAYAGTQLAGLVTPAGGYGWQKFVVQEDGDYQVVIRGASGGCANEKATVIIDPVTGVCSGPVSSKAGANGVKGNSYSRGGRGAKLIGNVKLKKNDVLYLLVGWYGKTSSDSYGGGGGGASVLLKENTNGEYQLDVVGKKVDILMVAGGGGGGCSQQHVLNFNLAAGHDAVVANGTSTTGGTFIVDMTQETSRPTAENKYHGGGGAGLTGPGSSSSGSRTIPLSILSGTNSWGSGSCIASWGGGGLNYENGGGGGGYSGGNANRSAFNYTNRKESLGAMGGDGGTSYINPNLIKEVFRGYATVAEDGNRDLVNPWYAHGSIEISYAAPSEKYILAEDSDGVKYFNGTTTKNGNSNPTGTDIWETIPEGTILSEAKYKELGNYAITNKTGLKNSVKFLVMSLSEDDNIFIDGHVYKSIIKQNFDTNMADISLIKSLTSTTNLTGVDIKFAISKNSGKTWQTFSGGNWIDVDITNKDTFFTDGYNLSLITTIPVETWNSYNAKNLRFAFIITQTADTENSLVQTIDFLTDLTGSWRKAQEADAYYEYSAIDNLRVTFSKAGNYKVNYLDSLGS